MVLLGLPLQLGHDGLGSGPHHDTELLLAPFLFLQHVLNLLETGLNIRGDGGQLGHGLLQLRHALRPHTEASATVNDLLRHRGQEVNVRNVLQL